MKTFLQFIDESINSRHPLKLAYRQGSRDMDTAYGNTNDRHLRSADLVGNAKKLKQSRSKVYSSSKNTESPSTHRAYNQGAADANDNVTGKSNAKRNFDTLKHSHEKEQDRYTGGSKIGKRRIEKKSVK